MDQEELDRVLRIVRKLSPKHLDTEELAIEILTTSWINGIDHSSFPFIRHKVLNAVRDDHTRREKDTLSLYCKEIKMVDGHGEVDTVETLARVTPILSRAERTAIWYRFYLELSLQEIANRMRLSAPRVSGLIHEGLLRMRKELDNAVRTQEVGAA